jgi:ferredoxin
MPAYLARAPAAPRDYAACSGCSLCLLVCPMWRRSHDPRLTPEGVAKALQCGATVAQLAEPIEACSLCGACDTVCPEGIDLTGLIMDLRRKLPPYPEITGRPGLSQIVGAGGTVIGPAASTSAALLLPGPDLRADVALLARVRIQLGAAVADDDGADISLALETGVEISQLRLQQFLAPLRDRTLVAADGLLLRYLRRWLPGSRRAGLGAALSSMATVRGKLGASDLYVIEPRAYHADYERLVTYYDKLRKDTGCMLNLDLQRIAIPAVAQGLRRSLGQLASDDTVQATWILQGRKPTRIVVESLADRAAFRQVCDVPVVHLADLVQD